jgi:hypothetical protein
MDYIWVIADNNLKEPFYTSDAPVVLRPHLNRSPYAGAGIGSKGMEVVLPLSSQYLLILRERTFFSPEWLPLEGTVMPMLRDAIPIYNGYQAVNSYRQVFCSENKFDLIHDLLAKFPEIGDKERPRFTIN